MVQVPQLLHSAVIPRPAIRQLNLLSTLLHSLQLHLESVNHFDFRTARASATMSRFIQIFWIMPISARSTPTLSHSESSWMPSASGRHSTLCVVCYSHRAFNIRHWNPWLSPYAGNTVRHSGRVAAAVCRIASANTLTANDFPNRPVRCPVTVVRDVRLICRRMLCRIDCVTALPIVRICRMRRRARIVRRTRCIAVEEGHVLHDRPGAMGSWTVQTEVTKRIAVKHYHFHS